MKDKEGWEQRHFICEDTKEECNGYMNYLKTKHGRELRVRLYRQFGRRCSRCGKAFELRDCNVHHLTYDRVGHENDSDLVLLCHDCHKLAHGKKVRQKKSWKEKTWKKGL